MQQISTDWVSPSTRIDAIVNRHKMIFTVEIQQFAANISASIQRRHYGVQTTFKPLFKESVA